MTTLNEQMREKARLLLSKALVKIHPEGVIVRTDLNEAAAEVLAAALTEAHAAGRQEILDRLPSTIDMIGYAGWLFHESDSNHIERRVGFVAAFNWLKSRLMGEGDK